MTGVEVSGHQEGPRRFLIATAISRYPKNPGWDRPDLVQAREGIIGLFAGQLGYRHQTALGMDPTRSQLTDQLRAFCKSSDRREDDLVAVYVSGHGEVLDDGGDHVLYTSDTDPKDTVYTSLPTVELARAMLRDTPVRRLLLMLDTCYSGQGGNEMTAAALNRINHQWRRATGSGLVIISSAQSHQQARAGTFPKLFTDAVSSWATAGHGPEALAVSTLVEHMNNSPVRPEHQRINLTLVGLSGEPPAFLANPRRNSSLTGVDLAIQHAEEFDAQAKRRDTELTTRLLMRAMGSSDPRLRNWWFSGRQQVLADLIRWLRNPGAADGFAACRVVTAGPGSGKTAVLGLIAVLSHPEHRLTVPIRSLELSERLMPDEGSVDVAIYAQSLTTADVLAGLAAAAGLRVKTVGEFLQGLKDQNREQPFTALIDALDEAATPDTLCSQIVRPLIIHGRGRIRLLLGTRPYLLHCLGITPGTPAYHEQVVDLDDAHYADPRALMIYTIRNLLEAQPDSPYKEMPGALRPVAAAVTEAAGTSFLVARITAGTLAAADTVVTDPGDPQWRAGLPRHAGTAMRNDLTNRLGENARRATDLLRPLAFALGQGLPWEDIWAPLATEISGRPYTNADLMWLRRNAGAYVVEATETDRSAYRLYHQALVEHLRDGVDASQVHAAYVTVLAQAVTYSADGIRDWSRAHPYTRRYLATHAAESGRLDELIENADFLLHADPHTLLSALHHVTTQQGRLIRAVYRASVGRHRGLAPADRRCLLAVDAARHQAEDLRASLASTLPWAPRWATGGQASLALEATLAGHVGGVRALACLEVEGRMTAITGGDDPDVRVWDLETGTCRRTLTGHNGGVRVMACLTLPDRSLVVAGDGSKHVRVWDEADGALLRTFQGEVLSMACLVLDGRPVAVTGHGDGDVRVWDLRDGTEVRVLRGHQRGVRALACTVVDGRPVVVTGDGAALVRLWDLRSGTLVRTFEGHRGGRVSAVTCAVWDGRPIAVTGDRSRQRNKPGGAGIRPGRHPRLIRVWDLSTGESLAAIGSPGGVTALAVGLLEDMPVVVCGDDTGDVQVRELPGGRTLRQLAGHTRGASAVACVQRDGRLVTLTTGRDREVLVWDMSTEDASAQARHTGAVRSVACTTLEGHSVAVSASADGKARLWNVASGSCLSALPILPARARAAACTTDRLGVPQAVVGDSEGRLWLWHLGTFKARPLGRHKGDVRAAACTVLGGRRIAVTGADEPVVRVWDLPSRSELCALAGHDGGVRAVACTVLEGRPVAVIGCDNGEVRLWDLQDAKPVGLLFDREGVVRSVACAVWDGQPVVVTGGDNGEIHVWELTHGGALLRKFNVGSRIWTVACVMRYDRPVVVTGGWAGTVQVWDLDDQDLGGPRYVLPQPHAVPSVAVAPTGELVIASGSEVITFAPAGEAPTSAMEW
ncbi:WD40 repeat domain-containing protein [Streptomyces europaeiscabiei]|uniref:WD40 repeat domain-containing protein n=1 Tax=Streptomyces europaeiscabiei TaxID=146819 RepID=UPI0029A4C12E|nr:WD40 repeat domain-containing protein [Streptomyces europaeiscabiei]MDX3775990.1 WD40 repeat domain-containing protein [Streptomyces europaeiscabiei]